MGEGHSLQIEKLDATEYLFDLEVDPKETVNLSELMKSARTESEVLFCLL
ncbi:hypothetical protein [Geofilum rubicundum]|nr:hypothetical protein [Geofilum rubicundum]